MSKSLTPVRLVAALALAGGAWFASGARAQDIKVDSETFAGLDPRAIGPAVMSGRISAIDAVQGERLTVWVGAASGGVWKSIDGGISFKPVFDKHVQSIGDLRIDPTDPSTVWVGTGEPWTRNSVSAGEGVFKTTNGGEEWQKVGLDSTERVSRICIHPTQSDTVYVAAQGALWRSNPQRGVYRTYDGGKTWTRVLYVNDETGCADLAMDPAQPNILYAAMWQHRRKPYSFTSGGPGSGLYKTTDGGTTWKKLANGLPKGTMGRIALDVSPAMPERVFAIVEAKDKEGALYRSDDRGDSWTRMNAGPNVTGRMFYFGRIVAHPTDAKKLYRPGFSLGLSEDGGATFAMIGGATHGDHHALWVNPKRPAQLVLGTDGGVYVSEDGGDFWRFVGTLPVSQFYHVAADQEFPYNVYGGLQDNGTWMGPSQFPGGIGARHWRSIGFGDGFWALPDPADPDVVFVEWQGGRLQRFHRSTGESKDIAPMEAPGDPKLRYNWNSPMHFGEKSGAFYFGSQFLTRTRDKGDRWERISPDLTTNDPKKQQQELSGGVSVDNSSAENHCTIYTICESPMNGDLVWVGTDDGNLQVTRDGGKSWTNVTKNVKGLPLNTWVSTVTASRFAEGTAYATFDNHAHGDFNTYVYKTSDYGKTWQSLVTPELKWWAHVIKEDRENANLLFLGTEWGLYVSVDGGKQWGQMTPGLPNVPVRDMVVHPVQGDLVVATHGRGVYIIDDLSPLRALDAKALAADAVFLPARPNVMKIPSSEQRFDSDENFVGNSLPEAAFVHYYLKKRHMFGDLRVELYNAQNELVTAFPGGKRRGINRVLVPMRLKPPKSPPSANLVRQPGSFIGPRLPLGEYTIKLVKGKDTYDTKLTAIADPRSKYTAEDRALQQATVLKLYGMLGDLTYLTDMVIDARQQALDRMEKLPAKHAARKTLTTFAGQLETLRNTLSATREGLLTGEEQLREKLGQLYGSVNFNDGPPTGSQLENIKVMEAELALATGKAKAILDKDLPAINAALGKAQLDSVNAMSREDWNKKQTSG